MLPNLKILGLAFRLGKPVTVIFYLINFCLAKPYASKPKPYIRKHTSNQSGAVAIIIAITIPILIGIAGLALDLGKLFITKTELQNAADACALSAANELTGATTQFDSAEKAGQIAGQANKAYFQSAAVVLPDNSAVRFSQTLDGTYLTKNSLTGLTAAQAALYKYVKCTATKSNIADFLIQVLNVMPGVSIAPMQSVAAAAVATLAPSQSTCAVPIGLCSSQVNNTTAKGTWISGVIGPPNAQGLDSQVKSGSFKWIDFTPNAGGAKDIKDLLIGSACVDPLPPKGTTLQEPGFKGSARNAFNTRFGLEAGGLSGTPDKTGYSYYDTAIKNVNGKDTVVPGNWPSKANAYNNFLTTSKGQEYQESKPNYDGSITGIQLVNATDKVSLANGKNRRVVVAPVIDCKTLNLVSYACVLLLHPVQTKNNSDFTMYLEYLGNANTVGPCSQIGFAAGPTSPGPLVSALVQ